VFAPGESSCFASRSGPDWNLSDLEYSPIPLRG
jgi:hypothetical protein